MAVPLFGEWQAGHLNFEPPGLSPNALVDKFIGLSENVGYPICAPNWATYLATC